MNTDSTTVAKETKVSWPWDGSVSNFCKRPALNWQNWESQSVLLLFAASPELMKSVMAELHTNTGMHVK
jgi:hypothetical protein